MKWDRFFISILLTLTSFAGFAGDFQDLGRIKETAEDFVHSNLALSGDKRFQISSGQLDPRLRLAPCDATLEAFSPPGSRLQGNTTIGIRCSAPKPWSIYMPVKIAVYQHAMIFRDKMARGHIIGSDDIAFEEVDVSRIRGKLFIRKEQVIGTKLKSSVQANQVLDSAQICLICKGDAVIISASSHSISVTMAGVALNDGSKGDKIRVQNNASRQIIDAVITNNGTVKAGI